MLRTIIFYEEDDAGNLVVDFESNTDGSYSVDGNVITLTEGLDRGIELTFEDYTLTAYYSFWQECFATRTFTKRDE